MSELGLLDVMSCIVVSEDVGVEKPHPTIFRHAIDLLGIPTPDCLYVGDDFGRDVLGATAAGLVACWLNRDGIIPPAAARTTYLEIRELTELAGVLRVIERRSTPCSVRRRRTSRWVFVGS